MTTGQLQFNFTPKTHSSHPTSSYKAAGRVDLTQAAQFALQTFKQYPEYTRQGLAEIIGYKAAERACKRAHDLCDGLADMTGDERYRGLVSRKPCPITGEITNTTTEKGARWLLGLSKGMK